VSRPHVRMGRRQGLRALATCVRTALAAAAGVAAATPAAARTLQTQTAPPPQKAHTHTYRMLMPLSGSTSPHAAWCSGLMDRSAALTSHTATGSNHTSGAPDSPYWCGVCNARAGGSGGGGRCAGIGCVS
jgi:hypothetical protein